MLCTKITSCTYVYILVTLNRIIDGPKRWVLTLYIFEFWRIYLGFLAIVHHVCHHPWPIIHLSRSAGWVYLN